MYAMADGSVSKMYKQKGMQSQKAHMDSCLSVSSIFWFSATQEILKNIIKIQYNGFYCNQLTPLNAGFKPRLMKLGHKSLVSLKKLVHN